MPGGGYGYGMEITSKQIDNDELRQSLEHLLQTDFTALHEGIDQLQNQLHSLETMSNPLPGDIHLIKESCKN